MANAKHLRTLKRGVEVWNNWRRTHEGIDPELRGADLSAADLRVADLRGADLRGADLRGAGLRGAGLRGANLSEANLSEANLSEANLSEANLSEANLSEANLSEANLSEANLLGANLLGADLLGADLLGADLSLADLLGADLLGADLSEANLSEANLSEANLSRACLSRANLSAATMEKTSFTEARLWRTNFAFMALNTAKGLETCKHAGPSAMDYHTLRASGPLPEVFLRGCGLSDAFVQYLPSFWNQPIEFYSCFISYSHADKAFARRLHDALQGRGIRCWLDEHEILAGDKIHRAVDKGVRLWDKVLLCCSEAALKSWWVDQEVQKAIMKEERLSKERDKEILAIIPLNLDGFMFRTDWTDWKQQHLITRKAPDFKGWDRDNAKFELHLEAVIKALRADAAAREKPPTPRL